MHERRFLLSIQSSRHARALVQSKKNYMKHLNCKRSLMLACLLTTQNIYFPTFNATRYTLARPQLFALKTYALNYAFQRLKYPSIKSHALALVSLSLAQRLKYPKRSSSNFIVLTNILKYFSKFVKHYFLTFFFQSLQPCNFRRFGPLKNF